jgi:1-phosphatidylinositol phosphodiesterase
MRLAPLFVLLASACSGDGGPTDPGWMTAQPDERSLAVLSIPGTHESAALYEPLSSGTAKCQNMTVAEQLEAGVRYFDIRCRHLNDGFQIYHGPIFQQQTFDQVLSTMYAFLDEHPQQTLIMSVKEEFTAEMTTRSFSDTFQAYVDQTPERWHLGPTVPVLGDVRGKIVLVRRFPTMTMPLGIDAHTMWGDDKTFTMASADATVRVQDQYKVDDNDQKWLAITSLFDEAATGPATTWFINYTSGYRQSLGIPNTPEVANDINARLDVYYADTSHDSARLGTVASDFTTESRIRSVISHNSP